MVNIAIAVFRRFWLGWATIYIDEGKIGMEQYRPNNGLFDLAATAGVVYLGVYSLLLNLARIGEGVDI